MIDLERLAREAGVTGNEYRIWPPTFSKVYTLDKQKLERFAQLVAEEAAKVVQSAPWPTWAEAGDERDVFSEAIRAAFGIDGAGSG